MQINFNQLNKTRNIASIKKNNKAIYRPMRLQTKIRQSVLSRSKQNKESK